MSQIKAVMNTFRLYENGGMPGNISILKDNPNDLDKYLEGIFSTIVYKDILARNNITDKMLLESVLKFILIV